MKINFFLATSVFFFSVNSVCAADHFALGTEAYTKGNFGTARDEFQQALKSDPKNWEAQYELANTLIELKDVAGAEAAYKACLKMKITPEISKNCQHAITYLTTPHPPAKSNAIQAPVSGAPTSTPGAATRTDSATSASTNPVASAVTAPPTSTQSALDEARVAAIEAHKKNIHDDEVRQIARIKAEQEEAMANGDAASWHHYRNANGDRYTAMSSDERAAMRKEYDDRIRQLHEDTERRIKECTTP